MPTDGGPEDTRVLAANDGAAERGVHHDAGVPRHPGSRFIKAAIAILGETGRTDFTVNEVVTRARASLRAFYQQFATKDELLVALSGEVIARSTHAWRAEVDDLDASAALRLLIDRVGAQPTTDTQHSINKALSLHYENLAQTRPREFAMLLAPLHQLVKDILDRGVVEGAVSPNLDTQGAASVVTQTIMGAARIHILSAELTGTPVDNAVLHAFCMHGLAAHETN
ncbi:MAG: TetR/AcrR family transcriptional regulator [Mycobacterium sp.]